MSDALPPWPQVPACYGWLSLDARGNWRLKDEAVDHPGLIAFLNTHYACDDEGCWLVNNGPQRVFVKLERAPLIVRLHPGQRPLAHTGRQVEPRGDVLIDALGRPHFDTDSGPASIDDRDLASFLDELTLRDGRAPTDDEILALTSAGRRPELLWRGLTLCPSADADIPDRLGYRREPKG